MATLPESVDYTDKDFDALRARLIALVKSVFPDWTDFDVASFGNLLVELYAFVGDVLTFYQDNLARESRLVTATQRKSVMALAKMLGYRLQGAQTATADVLVQLVRPPAATVTIPAGTVLRTQEVTEPVRFQLLAAAVIAPGADPPRVVAVVENSKTYTQLFDARGLADLELHLDYAPYLDGSALVTTPQGAFAEVDSFLDSRANDRHFVVAVDQNDRATLRFGNGVSGMPPSGTVSVTYKTGGGSVGNVVPHPLRPLIAYHRTLLPRIYNIFCDSIQRFYQEQLADLGHAGGRTGSVTAIQRASSDLRLNPHLHGVFLDGVFIERSDGSLSFVRLPKLSDIDVCELLQTIVARVLAHLRRQGLLAVDDVLDAAQDDSEQLVLSALADAAAFGRSLAGPETRPGRIPYVHQASEDAHTSSPLCATYAGFSLHANTHVDADDKPARERLIKYILRPPLAAERIERLDGGRVRLRLKRPFSDGTWAVEMDELSLVARLAALVPPPWQNQVRYSGVLAPASSWRSRIVPQPPSDESTQDCGHPEQPLEENANTRKLPKGKGSRYWPWRFLKARTFGEQTTKCPHCSGDLKLRALVQDKRSIHRILTHLSLPTHVPKPAPARGPPYYRGPVRRLRPGGPQQELLP